MTPERKKKLRLLLRRKAAEELKRQQEAKATERRRVIAERAGQKKNFDAMSESKFEKINNDSQSFTVLIDQIINQLFKFQNKLKTS